MQLSTGLDVFCSISSIGPNEIASRLQAGGVLGGGARPLPGGAVRSGLLPRRYRPALCVTRA